LHNRLERRLPSLLIFDCDGVLVDSELIDARIRSECFQDERFPVTAEDLQQHPGISSAGLAEMIEERFGRPIPDGFMRAARAKIMDVFTQELRAIDGIAELLRSLTVPVCVASNSHTDRVRHSLQVTDVWQFFDPACVQRDDRRTRKTCSRSLPLCRSEIRHPARRMPRGRR
jgi:beta-phosphoglucomutase-like phosphatase (HAD superfamily)